MSRKINKDSGRSPLKKISKQSIVLYDKSREKDAWNLFSHLDVLELNVKCKDSSFREKQRPSWSDARFCQWLSQCHCLHDTITSTQMCQQMSQQCVITSKIFFFLNVEEQHLTAIVTLCACAVYNPCWVYPTWDCALTLAPFVTSSLTTSVWPASEAMCRAVFPFWITRNKHRNAC